MHCIIIDKPEKPIKNEPVQKVNLLIGMLAKILKPLVVSKRAKTTPLAKYVLPNNRDKSFIGKLNTPRVYKISVRR